MASDSMRSHRHILHFGRDDVTTFYTDLLRRVSFPYHELDLNRRLDWQMMNELTMRTCTLLDVSCLSVLRWQLGSIPSICSILWPSMSGRSKYDGKARPPRSTSYRHSIKLFLRQQYVMP